MADSWYLLIHQLPTKPIYLRARIGQRLARAGALALKSSVYALPHDPGNLAKLRAILEEARASGGEAHICEAEFVEGITSEELTRRFVGAREADYAALSADVRVAATSIDRRNGLGRLESSNTARLTRLKRRFAEIRAIDSLGAPGAKEAASLLATLERRLSVTAREDRTTRPPSNTSGLVGRVWATRRGLHIDRIGSAWLIRRFIDPRARFRFIDPKEARKPGELRFDMVGGDFTHDGDACTFEALVGLIRSPDPALRQVAEIVHDVDLQDGKFGRKDAAGVRQIVLGIILDCPADDDRLRRGFGLFDDLYASFRQRSRGADSGTPSRARTRKGKP